MISCVKFLLCNEIKIQDLKLYLHLQYACRYGKIIVLILFIAEKHSWCTSNSLYVNLYVQRYFCIYVYAWQYVGFIEVECMHCRLLKRRSLQNWKKRNQDWLLINIGIWYGRCGRNLLTTLSTRYLLHPWML
jgi:hypothetical protein